VIGDLHWLIHQGHVIEFANGILETAKKPLPKPPKPAAPAAPAAPEAVKTETPPLEPEANTPAVEAEVSAEAAPDAAQAESTTSTPEMSAPTAEHQETSVLPGER